MEIKYDVRFCSCGRIHFIDDKDISEAISEDKELVLICGGCGKALFIGANKTMYELESDEPEEVYELYSYIEEKYFKIDSDNFTKRIEYLKTIGWIRYKPIHMIVYNPGKKVYMKSGNIATLFINGVFHDQLISEFEQERFLHRYKLKEEGIPYIKTNHGTSVDMERLINDLTEDELEALSGYAINSFDWSGTKYERK